MLEILFLVWFVRRLAAIAKAKGRTGGWGGLGAAFWIGGEFAGFIAGSLADAGAAAYLVALVCAGVGAAVAYLIVKSLPAASAPWEAAGSYAPVAAGGPVPPSAGPQDLSNPYSPPRAG
jgi:hypothetical protein